MKPFLIDAKQIRELTGLSKATFTREWNFPKPVIIRASRKLWKRSDVKKWVKKLACYSNH